MIQYMYKIIDIYAKEKKIYKEYIIIIINLYRKL